MVTREVQGTASHGCLNPILTVSQSAESTALSARTRKRCSWRAHHRPTAPRFGGLTLYSLGYPDLGAASGDIRTKLRRRDWFFRLNPKA